MATGAATERSLGKLHSKLTEVFIRVLNRYEDRLAVMTAVREGNAEVTGEIESEVLDELFNEGAMPNPAMLGAISKFLKDNEISFDTEQVNELGSLERRLKEQREKRGNVVSLSNLPRVAEGG